ncbi:TonB-dependent receptor [Sphingobium sp. SCG-1]|uniref:TonB-dependent receptor n=1 Tax=Sphingobium sp. SCG-1 TaxID=2072936 RepID=UPI000CD6993C|nr:TonB-dependent receptor [Sphingobium sp. SCG-1]AUW57185.1 TonB-dependent receptor [Sphingobium sp. SCG-1]
MLGAKIRWRTACSGLSLVFVMMTVSGVQAQVGNPTENLPQQVPANSDMTLPSAGSKDASAIADIVVTAQRRSENLQRVPIAITAVSGDQLMSAGVTSTQQLNIAVPGLNLRSSIGAFQPSIRGIGTTSSVVENPVALYVDGVYLPQQRDGTRELPDVEQLTVLKGPQGTLFGRNATGGVIQITTRRPSHTFGVEAKAEYDNYETFRGSAYLTGGLSQDLAASLSVQYADQGEGYGRNLTTGNDTFKLRHAFSARGKLLWEPGSDTSVILIGDYMERADLTNSFQPYPGTTSRSPGIGPLRNRYDTYSSTDPRSAYRSGGASVTIEHDIGFADITSITAYRQGKTRYNFETSAAPVPYQTAGTSNGPNELFTQELQLSSQAGSALTWTVGLFYFYYINELFPITRTFAGYLAPNPTSNARTDSFGSEKTESVAAFGQATYEFLPATRLTLGLRYSYERRDFEGRVDTIRNNGSTASALYNGRLEVDDPTWRVNVDHDFNDHIMGYLSWNRGNKSGGFNIQQPQNPVYQPERLDAFELGLKTQFFNRRLRLNAAAFYYDYSNLQVIQFLNAIQTIVNGPKAELYGLDVDLSARVTNRLTLSGGFALLSAKFIDYSGAVFSTPLPTGGSQARPGDASGNRLPQAQNVTATLSMNYELPTRIGNFNFNLTNNYNGDYYAESDNFLRQPAYVMTNLGVTWISPDETYSVGAFVRNLWDERIATQLSTSPTIYQAAWGGAPRTAGITARIKM